ncbi:MAG: SigB/SigF/SigG family RNA polymerase sigma factor [Clostridia bacterium]|nr:SigB/SigF/SigG family RNA polymerase sigma factor [Clostridia bacterium]
MYTARNIVQGDALLAQYALTRAPDLRDRIVEAYLYIAEIVARKFSGRGVDYDDLYQVAALALVKGIERFDADKGIKFASFITPTMVGEVKNYFRDRSRIIRLPRRSAQLARELRETRAILEQELGRSPTVDELAERMNISEDDVLEALEMSNAMTPASLDAQVADEDSETSLSTFLGFNDPGYSDFERNDMLDRALSTLDNRQRAVIIARFYEGLSQRDVAAQLNISQMTVSRIERQALEKLRERMTEQE